jgi:hypothetical protein
MSSDIIFNLLANFVMHDFRDGAILNSRVLDIPLQRVADILPVLFLNALVSRRITSAASMRTSLVGSRRSVQVLKSTGEKSIRSTTFI